MTEPACLVVVCEAPADLAVATRLADRKLAERIGAPEVDAETRLDPVRRWEGEPPERAYFRWGSVKERADELGIRVHGHFDDDEPGAPDAHQARRALHILARRRRLPAAVVLMRDSDDDPGRRRGLEQARKQGAWPFPVLLAVAHPKRECWILSGFVPKTPEERGSVEAMTRRCGFDPCERPHELTARSKGAGVKRNAKEVLAALSGGNFKRELECLEQPWELLQRRGAAAGLPEYLREVEQRLAPLLA